ncbi:DUF222 domain-containing protein [Microbacterium sp.]|uniref:HNH endonuclease signature motif containing protein n=1 Tax=Microbacterium sp. TaxID=51671 RepID=UPI003A84D654
MTFLTEFTERARRVVGHRELDVDAGELVATLRSLGDDAVVGMVADVAALEVCAERLKVAAAAVIAERSATPGGGLSGGRGHRSAVTLVQEITGGTRADASRTIRVGQSLLDGEAAPAGTDGAAGTGADAEELGDAGTPEGGAAGPGGACVWHAGLRTALFQGELTAAQHDAIRGGLGEPPSVADADQVWAVAARKLVDEAASIPVEQLAKRARAMRDALDPDGAADRFTARFETRSFRMWTDEHGARHARIAFDDEMAAWVDAVFDAALRPRRGGPRFMTDAERARAADLARDERSNDQLAYDLAMDLFRAGALATTEDVFGARQAGVRLVALTDTIGPRDAFGRLRTVVHVEDGGAALPGAVLDRALCDTGTVPVTLDRHGNPLDVGREHRLYTPKQRIALAIRDGGCMWPGCDRPPGYCEAHHQEPWSHGGQTNCDTGILLCRYHHLLLHNQGWRITRPGHGPFHLHPPGGGEAIPLRSRSPLTWAWAPPPDRPGWRTASAAPAARHGMPSADDARTPCRPRPPPPGRGPR